MNNVNRLQRTLRNEQASVSAEPRKNEASRSDVINKDQVSISTQAQEALRLREVVLGTSDIRADKVKALQEAIAQGTYHVPAKAIAEKMLGTPGGKR